MKMILRDESSNKPRPRGSRGLPSICRPLPERETSLDDRLVNRSGKSDTISQPLRPVERRSDLTSSQLSTAEVPLLLPGTSSSDRGSSIGLENPVTIVLDLNDVPFELIGADDSVRLILLSALKKKLTTP